MPEEVVGGSTILRRHDDGKEIELKQPAPGYATIFRYVRKRCVNMGNVLYLTVPEAREFFIAARQPTTKG